MNKLNGTMTNSENEMLASLVRTGVYEVLWNQLFFKNRKLEYAPHSQQIRNERYLEHRDDYCEALSITPDTLKSVLRIIVRDAEERKKVTGKYTMFDELDFRRQEITKILQDNKPMLSNRHKDILDMYGNYEKAMKSSIVNQWLEYQNTGVTKDVIYNYYQAKN